MIRFNISLSKEDRKKIENLDKEIFDGFVEGFENAMDLAVDTAQDFAPVKTGRLRKSIKAGSTITDRKAYGWIGSDVVYARIQEEGGVIRPKGQYLKFMGNDGNWKYVRQTVIKPKKYLERALISRLDEIEREIEDVIIRTVRRK